MKSKEFIVVTTTLTLLIGTVALSLVGQVLSTMQTNKTVYNSGTVKAIGVGVYSDFECTNQLASINWGTFEPGSSKNITCYLKNEGTSVSNLSMYTSNWNPTTASNDITLWWDYDGQPINPDEVIKVIFTLSVSFSTNGTTGFSFEIIITGIG